MKHNPGSPEALREGCLCPVIDNCHGRGYKDQPGQFWYDPQCPVHCLEHDHAFMHFVAWVLGVGVAACILAFTIG